MRPTKASIMVTIKIVPRAQHGALFMCRAARLRNGLVHPPLRECSCRAVLGELRKAARAARFSAASCGLTSQKPPQYDDDVDLAPEVVDLLSTTAEWLTLAAGALGGFPSIRLQRSEHYESMRFYPRRRGLWRASPLASPLDSNE